MNRITHRFQELRRAGRKVLIPYITAGDPHPELTVPMLHALVAAGADIIELGVPFSDPMADGPVIQKACERALAQGMTPRRVLELVREFRQIDAQTPLVLMGYLNPIERMGHAAFVAAARDAGVDGVLTVDLPPEEAAEPIELMSAAGIAPIFLVAPTSSVERIRRTAQLAQGYLYYVSLKGVTGSAALNVAEVAEKLATIRACTDLPLGVGFGIKDPPTAAAVARIADAVVVGSALVAKMHELADDPERMRREVAAQLAAMRQAMDQAGMPTAFAG
ncbi:tryptophan synthase subunit alpha [Candidatus Competibacter phosphatis]|uniref:Tryptophan synthase alpha chain n=1 Tax=Candidatus Competibacter phosphatis TaxID=221280 RepID=A0ABX1TJN8_9GAMM|nr:tryptophan synthase subunit alpha [Candidatus Competibacter phosphatis]NMQ19601.1 tryptophan synthase subunit alpha [Candidatus Competibacter phosphatis]